MQIQEIVGRDVNVKAIVACFLIHEGASTQIRNILGQTPLEGCTDPVLATVIATFAEQHAGLVLISPRPQALSLGSSMLHLFTRATLKRSGSLGTRLVLIHVV